MLRVERPGAVTAIGRVPWLFVAMGGGLAFAAVSLVGRAGLGHYLVPGPGGTTYEDAPFLLALFVPYALALLAYRRHRGPSSRTILVAGITLHAALLAVPPAGSQDLFQSLFYGRMWWAHGANPYVMEPLAFASDPWFGYITWTTQPTVYGPAWTYLTTTLVALSGSSLVAAFLATKLLVLALDLAVMGLLLAVARDRDSDGGFRLLAWAFNPLVLMAVPVEGHPDVAIGAAFLGAVMLRGRGRVGWATALLVVAAMVKAYAGVALLLHLVLLARERGPRTAIRHGAAAAVLTAALYAPFFHGLDTFRGLGGVAGRLGTSLTGTLARLITLEGPGASPDPGPGGAAILALGAAFAAVVLVVLVQRLRSDEELWSAVTLGLGAYFLATPWFFFWHLLPLVAVACALPRDRTSPAVLVASASVLVAVRLPAYHVGLALQAALRYLPPLLVYGRAAREGRTAGPRVPIRVPRP